MGTFTVFIQGKPYCAWDKKYLEGFFPKRMIHQSCSGTHNDQQKVVAYLRKYFPSHWKIELRRGDCPVYAEDREYRYEVEAAYDRATHDAEYDS